jgi:bacterial/archaeal transporter family-2 protein
MPAIIVVVIAGLLGGIAVGLQGPLASMISQRIGIMESAFIVHLGGTLAALIFLASVRGGHLGNWRTVPWYALGAGVLGLIVVSAISYTIPRLGVATTVTLIVTGQLADRGNARSLWDVGGSSPTFGVVPLDWSRCGLCWDMANGAVK